MSDADFKLLRDSLFAVYRSVNPELSHFGDHLVRRLADGLYARGARIQIGSPEPVHHIHIHHSVDPLGNVLWTCRRWNQAMGYASQAPVGKHISQFLDPGTYTMMQEHYWAELVQHGKIEGIPVVMVTSTQQLLTGTAKSEILRDEKGGFLRTFAKIKVGIPAALARIASVLTLAVGLGVA